MVDYVILTFLATLTLTFDLDLSKSNHLLLWSYTTFSQNFIQIGVVLFDFVSDLDLDL